MIDRKSNIPITINALILSIVIGTVLNQLDKETPHLIFPSVVILATNLISIAYAIFTTRPEVKHGGRESNNVMFYGNFHEMGEADYIKELTGLIYQGDDLYRTIAKDTFHLGKTIDRKFKLLRKSVDIFLIGIILSVIGFIICHEFLAICFSLILRR